MLVASGACAFPFLDQSPRRILRVWKIRGGFFVESPEFAWVVVDEGVLLVLEEIEELMVVMLWDIFKVAESVERLMLVISSDDGIEVVFPWPESGLTIPLLIVPTATVPTHSSRGYNAQGVGPITVVPTQIRVEEQMLPPWGSRSETCVVT